MTASILDCTLRDGGYKNHWWFSNSELSLIARAAKSELISFVELGLMATRSNGVGPLGDLTPDNFEYLMSRHELPPKKSTVLANWSDIRGNIENAFAGELAKFRQRGLELVRITALEAHLQELEGVLPAIFDTGLKVSVNIMQAHSIGQQSREWISRSKSAESLAFIYLADTFGCMLPEDVENLVSEIVDLTSVPIGLHAHDNRGLAIENSIAALRAGAQIIDGTYGAMGRGSGNASLGSLLLDKRMSIESPEREKGILDAEEHFSKLRGESAWGSSLMMRIAADYGIHPLLAQSVDDYENFTLQEKVVALKSLAVLREPQKVEESLDYLPFRIGQIHPKTNFEPMPSFTKGRALIVFGDFSDLQGEVTENRLNKFDLKISLTERSDSEFLFACSSGYKALTWRESSTRARESRMLTYSQIAEFSELSDKNVLIVDPWVSPPDAKNSATAAPNTNSLSMTLVALTNAGFQEIYLHGIATEGVPSQLKKEMESGIQEARKLNPSLKIVSTTRTELGFLDAFTWDSLEDN